MTLFDIILLGYAVNFIAFILMAIVFILSALMNIGNEKYTLHIIELEKLKQNMDSTKEKLKEKNLSTQIQRDYIIYFPFAMVIELLSVVAYAVNGKITNWLAIRIVNKTSILEKRLHKSI